MQGALSQGYRDTAINAVNYEATNKPEDTSKSSPMIMIILVMTPPSVLKMMQGRMVRIVANMEVSLLLRT